MRNFQKYGKNVQLAYGGGSIKKNGIYDKVMEILKANGKNVFEDGGVMPNPTVEKLYEGVKIAREHKADLILAVGGGSVCDYAKAVSISVHCEEDPWEKYYLRMENVDNEIIGGLCPYYGRNRFRDERRVRHHQSRDEVKDRSCFRGKCISEVFDPESHIYIYFAEVSDDSGIF